MKRLPMRKIRDVLRLSAEGLSTRQIAASLAIGRTTLRGYLDRARDTDLSWPLSPEMSDTDLERLIYPRTARDVSNRAALPGWAHVHRELRRKGVTLSLLWEEYRADHTEGYGYSRLGRALHSVGRQALAGEAKIRASVASGAYAAPQGPQSPFAVGDRYEFKQVRAADQMIWGII